MYTGIGLGVTVTLLLTLLIKFFFIVFVGSIIIGLIIAGKNYLFSNEDLEALKAPFMKKEKENEN